MTAQLRFSNLTLGYDRHPAVHHLNGEVEAGALMAVVGPNGAGKSTLFNLILGEEKPDTGTIEWERGADFGFLPQESAPAGDETILHIATSGKKLEPTEDDYDIDYTLEPRAKKILAGLGFKEGDADKLAKVTVTAAPSTGCSATCARISSRRMSAFSAVALGSATANSSPPSRPTIASAGSEPVSVYARRVGDEVAISVTDLGKGIPQKDLARIFEKFFRRGKVDGRTPGTGLGLAISKGFVEAMGGTIKAESPAQKRRGTRITVQLPIDAIGANAGDY